MLQWKLEDRQIIMYITSIEADYTVYLRTLTQSDGCSGEIV